MNIFPTITTTNSRWKEKIKEADELGLTEIALFPTTLDKDQRREMYSLLGHSKIKSIPFVHIRSDMDLEEIENFIKKYNTQIFNIHSAKSFPIPIELMKYASVIAIENTNNTYLDEEEIKKFGGVCIDFTHLENDRVTDLNRYYKNYEIIVKSPIRCNHISAIKKSFIVEKTESKLRYDSHSFEELTEFDYLKKYSINLFTDFCALELENTLKDQLRAKEYILKIIRGRDTYVKKFFKNDY
jgi:hypothetical protein